MKLHARYWIVEKADIAISDRINGFRNDREELIRELCLVLVRAVSLRGTLSEDIREIADEHKLTRAELIRIISGQLQSIAKSAIRQERHPNDPGKAGDVE